jgi:20S proteasome alpha/beta subunit
MTLCIAAECWEETSPHIVMCCDLRAERGGLFQELVGSEDVDKIRTIGPMTALLSGSETDADELLTLCESAIRTFAASSPSDSDIAITTFMSQLREAASIRKKALVNHRLNMTISMSFDDFVRKHRTEFTEAHSREIWDQIRDTDLGADILLCGYCGDEPEIVRLDRYGKTFWETNYSAVGVGSDIAYIMLGQRDWLDEERGEPRLIDGLYRIFEAKRAAEKNRHVGESTAFEVLLPNGARKDITDECFQAMKKIYAERLKPPAFEELSNCLKNFDDEKKGSEAVIIPAVGSSFQATRPRHTVHDAMPPELQAKIDELKAREDKKE